MSDKTQKQIIQETHDDMVEVKTVLLGVPNTDEKGLVGEVRDIKLNVRSNTKSIGKIKVILAVIIGSGALGTGIWQLVGLING